MNFDCPIIAFSLPQINLTTQFIQTTTPVPLRTYRAGDPVIIFFERHTRLHRQCDYYVIQ